MSASPEIQEETYDFDAEVMGAWGPSTYGQKFGLKASNRTAMLRQKKLEEFSASEEFRKYFGSEAGINLDSTPFPVTKMMETMEKLEKNDDSDDLMRFWNTMFCEEPSLAACFSRLDIFYKRNLAEKYLPHLLSPANGVFENNMNVLTLHYLRLQEREWLREGDEGRHKCADARNMISKKLYWLCSRVLSQYNDGKKFQYSLPNMVLRVPTEFPAVVNTALNGLGNAGTDSNDESSFINVVLLCETSNLSFALAASKLYPEWRIYACVEEKDSNKVNDTSRQHLLSLNKGHEIIYGVTPSRLNSLQPTDSKTSPEHVGEIENILANANIIICNFPYIKNSPAKTRDLINTVFNSVFLYAKIGVHFILGLVREKVGISKQSAEVLSLKNSSMSTSFGTLDPTGGGGGDKNSSSTSTYLLNVCDSHGLYGTHPPDSTDSLVLYSAENKCSVASFLPERVNASDSSNYNGMTLNGPPYLVVESADARFYREFEEDLEDDENYSPYKMDKMDKDILNISCYPKGSKGLIKGLCKDLDEFWQENDRVAYKMRLITSRDRRGTHMWSKERLKASVPKYSLVNNDDREEKEGDIKDEGVKNKGGESEKDKVTVTERSGG